MPGLGFLFKKRFHPSRLDNQKRIFVAEKKVSDKNEREADSAKEVVKEKEMQYYESMGKMEFRDPRTSALKFMYATPQNKEEESGKTKPKQMATVKDYESKIDARTGDDEMVRAFREKIAQSKQMSLDSASSSHEYRVDPPDDKDIIDEQQSRTKGNNNAIEYMTKLEKEVGGKLRTEATHEEMQERFAVLKNAPVEGGYVKGMVMKHKPFNELLRNVHCIRCGAWGHMSGERECTLKDYNPNDYARQQREDPMARMMPICQPTATTSSTSSVTGAVSGSGAGSGAGSGYGRVDRRTSSKYVDEAGDSDPEAEFLASLTRREKKLLLIKLQVIGY